MGAVVRVTVFLLVLLLGPGLLSIVDAQSPVPAFTLMDIRRSGDAVTLEVRANRELFHSNISLLSNGVIVARPEWYRDHWADRETVSFTFRLLKDVDSATILYRWREGQARVSAESSEQVFVPASPGTSGVARVVATEAELVDTALTVRLANFGNATSRPLLVSVEDANQRKIGTPYHRDVAPLGAGAKVDVAFDVPAGLMAVVVAIEHAGVVERSTLSLSASTKPEETGEVNVSLATELPFREGDIGRTVDYTITVKNHGRPALIQLAAEGLADGYSARFFVGASGVPSLYLDKNQTRQVTLSITVPNAATEVDRTLDFATIARVNGTETGRLAMGVAVRGVGKLELSGLDGSPRIPPGGEASFPLSVRNSGSAPLFNVELDNRRPYGWTVRAEPNRLDRLDPGESRTMSLTVRAPDVIAGDRYSLDVAVKSGDVASRFVPLGVDVEEAGSGGGWVWAVFLVAIVGVLGAGAWWKWRG